MLIEALQIWLLSQAALLQGLQQVNKYLKGPIMIYHEGELSDIVVQNLASMHPVIIAQVPHQPSFCSQMPRSALFIGKNPDRLVSCLRKWSLWNGRTRILILAEKESDVFDWISTLWHGTRAVDIVVMVLTKANAEFYTWFPYQKNDCTNVSKIVKISANELFSDKIIPPLNQCPLQAVTSTLPPLVVSDSRGIEPRIFHTIADKLGMIASYVSLPANKYVWTTLDMKQEPANGLKLVWENEVDMTFSQLSRQFASSQFAEFLPSHTEDRSVFFAPGPKPAPRATAIYRAFSWRAWILVILTSFAIYLATIFIPYLEGRNSVSAFLVTIAIILNQSTNLPKTKIFQCFIVIAFLYSMHVTTVYQSSLIVFLSDVPREKPIQTWEELDKSPYPVEFHEGQRPNLNHVKNPHIMSMLTRPGKGIFTPFLHMSHVADPGNIAVLGPKLSFASKLVQDFYYDEFGYPKVVVLDQHLFTSHLCLYISKGHPLFPLMSRYMLQLIEAGMPQHYTAEVSKLPRPVLRQLRPFGIENVEGPFFLYAALTAICLLTCFVECAYERLKRKSETNT